MSRLFPRLMLVVGIGMTGAACQDDGNAAPRGYYQPAPTGYYQPAQTGYYQPAPTGYYQPAPTGYNSGYYSPQPAPNYNYANQQVRYNQADGRRYTTVTVTNRGQNGNRDDVVQQQVVCGSQYNDGYRTRTARC